MFLQCVSRLLDIHVYCEKLKLLMQDEALLSERSSACLTVKRDKKSRRACFCKYDSDLDINALKNWEKRMAERRCQQNYLSG